MSLFKRPIRMIDLDHYTVCVSVLLMAVIVGYNHAAMPPRTSSSTQLNEPVRVDRRFDSQPSESL